MRNAYMVLALAFAPAGGLRAQAAQRPVDLTGRAIVLRTVRDAPQDARGELLAVRPDSAWVLADAPRRVVAVRMVDVLGATVQRHGLTAAKGLVWGVAVGAASGVGLAVACNQVRGTSCGPIVLASAVVGLLFGGGAAVSYGFSSRWSFAPVTAETLAPFARFPQGPPPGGLDALGRTAPDSQVVRP